MTGIRYERLPDTSSTSIRTGLSRLLDETNLDPEGRVLVLPDTHYPYHPSTGQVTNPDVISELVECIEGEVAIGISGSTFIEADQVGRYLGYERVADLRGVPLVNLDAAERVERLVPFAEGSISLQVPEPLLETVVVVPTLRRSPRFGIAEGMVLLGRTVTDHPTRRQTLAATRISWPALSILDGTFSPMESPWQRNVLLASDDVVTTSMYAADLLGVSLSDIPHLGTRRMFSLPSLWPVDSTSDGRSTDGVTSEVLARGYRLYAQMTGDLVPPQMLPKGGDE